VGCLGMKWIVNVLAVSLLLGVGLGWPAPSQAASLDWEAQKVFRKIGIGPDQAEDYARLYEQFLSYRASQIRRVMNSHTGEELPVMVKKKARRAAKKSVKQMRAVLSEQQLQFYEQYLELANRIFLRDAGLR